MSYLKLILISVCLVFAGILTGNSQVPGGYYDSAEGLYGIELKQELHEIIDDHDLSSYDDIWGYFYDTDKKPDGHVWDIYSDNPDGAEPYEYDFVTDQCGNYGSEGDCYNREHSWPKSWFGDLSPMISDLFPVLPTDGYVNGTRGNLPYGEVNSASWTSENGCKKGTSALSWTNSVVFEPIDEYKGDVARIYFYFTVRYYNEDGDWPDGSQFPMVDGANIDQGALDMLMDWHDQDPVSNKEIDRNNAIYNIQGNRNPFVDRPEFASNLWEDTMSLGKNARIQVHVGPNPVTDNLHIAGDVSSLPLSISLYDMCGNYLFSKNVQELPASIDMRTLHPGMYVLKLQAKSSADTQKIIVL